MPDSDPLAHPPPDVDAVIARWNPQGHALLRALPTTEGFAAQAFPVQMIGVDDIGTALLRAELARLQPRIELTDPIADPSSPPHDSAESDCGAMAVALLVLDAGATLGATTLDLVARLHGQGTRIIFAVNGIHAHAEWRAVVARDRELLAPVLGHEPDLLPVSARMAEVARTSGDAALLDRSGLGALHARLTAAVGADGGQGGRAAIHARVVAETRRRILDQAAALRSGAAVARVREERATLLAGRDGGRAQAMSVLRNRLHLARVDLLHEVGARIRALNAAARTELDRLDRGAARGYPARLQRSVADLTAELDVALARRLTELARQLEAVTDPAATAALGPPGADPAPPLGPDPEPRHRGVEDHLMVALGASAGFGLGRLVVAPLSLVPALDYATVPVTLLLGAGVAYWVVRARGHLADRAHLRQWVSDALVNVKAQLEQRVATVLVEAESQLTEQVVRASTARAVDIDRRVAELETRLRQLTAQQPAQLAACERDLAALDAAGK